MTFQTYHIPPQPLRTKNTGTEEDRNIYPQLVSNRIFLIVKCESLNTRQRRRIDDAEGVMSHQPCVLVEG